MHWRGTAFERGRLEKRRNWSHPPARDPGTAVDRLRTPAISSNMRAAPGASTWKVACGFRKTRCEKHEAGSSDRTWYPVQSS